MELKQLIKEGKELRAWFLSIGFKEIPHFTIGNNLIMKLEHGRQFSIACLHEPNEMLFLSAMELGSRLTEIEDLVMIHNYDYHGYLTKDRFREIYLGITGKKLIENG